VARRVEVGAGSGVVQLALSVGDALAVFCIVDPRGDRRSTICSNVRENNDNGSARLGKTIRPSSVGRKARRERDVYRGVIYFRGRTD